MASSNDKMKTRSKGLKRTNESEIEMLKREFRETKENMDKELQELKDENARLRKSEEEKETLFTGIIKKQEADIQRLNDLIDECTTKLKETQQQNKTRDDISTPINRKRKRDLSTAKDSQNSAISTVSGSLPGAKRSRPRSRSRGTREKAVSEYKKVLREREKQKRKARKFDELQNALQAMVNLAGLDDTQSQDLSLSVSAQSTSVVSSSTSRVSPSQEE